MLLTPQVTAAWQHAFGAVTPTTALAFQSTGAGFTISGVPLARDAALIEAGIDLHLTPQITLGLAYFGDLAGNVQDNTLQGNLMWKF